MQGVASSNEESAVNTNRPKSKDNTKDFFNEPLLLRGHAKHAVLKTYLDGWFAIWLRNDNIPVYVDGFAGAGRYGDGDGELGSPLLIYKALAEHNNLPQGGEVRLIFFEKDKKSYVKLCENLEQAKRDYPIETPQLVINTEVHQGDFNDLMDDVLREYRNRPMFVFADPFGQNVKMKTLQKIVQSHGHYSPRELLINFMNSQLLRFLKHQNERKLITEDEFLGVAQDPSDDWRTECEGKTWQEKLNIVYEFYGRRLQDGHKDKEFGEFMPSIFNRNEKNRLLKFAMKGPSNAHIYHLIYVTCHEKGFKHMKSTMSRKSQNPKDFQYSEWVAAKGIVRDLNWDRQEIAKDLVGRIQENFNGRNIVPGKDVEDFVWFDTPYACTVKKELKQAFMVSGNISRDNGSNRALDQMTFTFSPGSGLSKKHESTEEIVQDLLERIQRGFNGEPNVLGTELALFIRFATPYKFNVKVELKEALKDAGCVSELNGEKRKAFTKTVFHFSGKESTALEYSTVRTVTVSTSQGFAPQYSSNGGGRAAAKRSRLVIHDTQMNSAD